MFEVAGSRRCWVLRLPEGVLVGNLIQYTRSRWLLIGRTLASGQFSFSQRTRPLVPLEVRLFQLRSIAHDPSPDAAGTDGDQPEARRLKVRSTNVTERSSESSSITTINRFCNWDGAETAVTPGLQLVSDSQSLGFDVDTDYAGKDILAYSDFRPPDRAGTAAVCCCNHRCTPRDH
jgi:hypothetical protein